MMRVKVGLVVLTCLTAALSACKARQFGDTRTIAGHNGLVTGTFEARVRVRGEAARFVTSGEQGARTLHARRFARTQARFIYRVFDGVLFDLDPEIQEISSRGEEAEVRYRLGFKIAPEKSSYAERVKEVQIFMPPYVDSEGLLDFYQRYGSQCLWPDAPEEFRTSDGASEQFFFFFHAYGCVRQLRAEAEIPGRVEMATVKTAPWNAPAQARLHLPEYERAWEDGKLAAVVLIASTGKSHNPAGDLEPGDAGEAAFNMIYHKLKKRYPNARIETRGEKTTLADRVSPLPGNWFVRFLDTGTAGRDLTLIFSPKVKITELPDDSPVRAAFHEASRDADLIAFAGHADIGGNVAALNQWGDYRARQHYTLYVNACWSAGYFFTPDVMESPNGIMGRIQALNPGQPWSRWLDIIVNADESNMYKMAWNTMALIDSFDSRSATLFEILNRLSQDARPLIMGDEDNPVRSEP